MESCVSVLSRVSLLTLETHKHQGVRRKNVCCYNKSVSVGIKIIIENIINFNGKMSDKFANCKERRMNFLCK